MNYVNPYGIIPVEAFQTLSRPDLKGLRKKVLLEFDLSDSNEIFRGEKGYDKNEVLEIFKSLEEHLEIYQKISILPKYQLFLEKGDLSFFNERKETQLVNYDPDYKNELNALVTKKLVSIIPPLVLEPTTNSAATLENINSFLSNVSPAGKEEAYNNTFLELTNVLNELQEIKTPFESERSLRIKPKVKKYINKTFYSSLRTLPDSFNKIRSDYGLWCNNNVLVPGINHRRINSAPRESLVVIRNAAKISSNYHNKEGNLKIVRQLDDRIKGGNTYSGNRNTTSSSEGGFKWYHLIYIVILLIKIPLIISKCSSNNSRSSYSNSRSYSNKQRADINKIMRQAQQSKKRKSAYTPRDNSAQLFRYCGEDRSFINAVYTGKGKKNGSTELRYNVDVLPSKNTFFYRLIPKEIKEKFKGQIVPIVFTFTDRDFKKDKFSHEVKVDFRKDKLEAEYNFKRPGEGLDDILKTKRLVNSKVKFAATISKIDATTHKISHKRKLNVSYDVTQNKFKARYTKPSKNLNIDKDYLDSPINYKNTTGSDSIRIAAIVKNLKLIPSSQLTRNGIYTMENVATYDLENLDKQSLGVKKPNSIQGRLKYRITSVADNTSLCSVTAQNIAAFYYIDSGSSRIKAMTMAIKSSDGKNLELVEVHLD